MSAAQIAGAVPGSPNSPASPTCIEREMIAGLIFEKSTGSITRDNRCARVGKLTFRIAHILFHNQGRVCSREMFLAGVWGFPEGMKTRRVDAQMSNVRRLLRDLDSPYELVSIRDKGYVLRLMDA